MNGKTLRRYRFDIGKAVIGRAFSYGELADLCGLSGARVRDDGVATNNGADTMRKWEDGDGPSGPVAMQIITYAQVLDPHASPAFRNAMASLIRKRLLSTGDYGPAN